ncbi:nucleotidyltransferase family protein [Mesorhizobium xinjiangense]|uniref:nucleotidyltransferase family protein n=1 Tax=Mesorhizobium xinjiangense TaxID=2678685 RepID=UPI0012ECDD30|nr:nucleotidyltransferase family protein [Mesorhizobium xinjiangense]
MHHLRYADLTADDQRAAFFRIVRADPIVAAALERARELELPGWRIVAGVLYNTVWNALTGRPSGYGIKDIDLFYFDAGDISYEAEDAVIARGAKVFADLPVPVEIRNQARVHLWFERHFGQPYPPLASSEEAIDRFACKTHAVGLRLEKDGRLNHYAPFGLDDIFSFRLAPNRLIDNRATHETKGRRAKECWPEVTVVPW